MHILYSSLRPAAAAPAAAWPTVTGVRTESDRRRPCLTLPLLSVNNGSAGVKRRLWAFCSVMAESKKKKKKHSKKYDQCNVVGRQKTHETNKTLQLLEKNVHGMKHSCKLSFCGVPLILHCC